MRLEELQIQAAMRVAELEGERERAFGEAEALRDEQQSLQQRLRDAEERTRALQSQLGAAMQAAGEADKLQAMQREYEQDVAALKRELDTRQAEVEGLKTQMRGRGRLQTEIDRLSQENRDVLKRASEADLEIQRQRLRADELESELAESRLWRGQAENRLESAQAALLELQRELEATRLNSGETAQLELRQAQLELQLAAEQREVLQQRVESLQAAARGEQELRTRLAEAEQRLAELRARQQVSEQTRPPSPTAAAPKRKGGSPVWSLLDAQPSSERQESRSGGLELPGF